MVSDGAARTISSALVLWGILGLVSLLVFGALVVLVISFMAGQAREMADRTRQQQAAFQHPAFEPAPGLQPPGVNPADLRPPGMNNGGFPGQPGQPGINPAELQPPSGVQPPGPMQPVFPPRPGVQPPGFPQQPGMRPPGFPQPPGMQPPGLPQPPGLRPLTPPSGVQPPDGPQVPGLPQPGVQPPVVPQLPGATATVVLSNFRRVQVIGAADELAVDFEYTAGAPHPVLDKLVVKTATATGEINMIGVTGQKGTLRIKAFGRARLQGKVEVWMERKAIGAATSGKRGQTISNMLTLE